MTRDLGQVTARYRAAQTAVEQTKTQAREAQEELRKARTELAETLVEKAKAGTRMRDLVATTGLSREWIRTRLRQAGVMPDE